LLAFSAKRTIVAKTKVKAETETEANGTPQSVKETVSPCYLLSLEIENVRCFGPKQTLELSDGNGKWAPWTFILGENGTGKTSLLQALVGIEAVIGSNFSKSGSPVTMPPERNRFIDFWARPQVPSSADAMGFARVSSMPGLTYCRVKWIGHPDSQDSDVTKQSRDAFWVLRNEKVEYVVPPHSLTFYAYGAGRRLGGMSLRQEPLDDPVGTLFDENALLRNAEEWLLQLDYAASKNSERLSEQEAQLKRVKSLLISILTDDIKDIRFATTGGVYPKARVEFQTFSGWVPLHRLGYGYQTLIAWVTDFASRMVERYPDSPDPFKEAAIVLVDEIDLHLHPLWQRKLIADLTKHFPNTQFIATAHSPLVVQAAENANIAVLRRNGDHVEIINDPEQIRGWRIDQILTSDLFGLESARSPQVEALFKRKEELVKKKKQNTRDKAELRELQAKIDELPVGDSAHFAKEMQAIQKALALLKDHQRK
jgi:predicted ATP-binding protein involved in virulence